MKKDDYYCNCNYRCTGPGTVFLSRRILSLVYFGNHTMTLFYCFLSPYWFLHLPLKILKLRQSPVEYTPLITYITAVAVRRGHVESRPRDMAVSDEETGCVRRVARRTRLASIAYDDNDDDDNNELDTETLLHDWLVARRSVASSRDRPSTTTHRRCVPRFGAEMTTMLVANKMPAAAAAAAWRCVLYPH